jgi:hypothetical protein
MMLQIEMVSHQSLIMELQKSLSAVVEVEVKEVETHLQEVEVVIHQLLLAAAHLARVMLVAVVPALTRQVEL